MRRLYCILTVMAAVSASVSAQEIHDGGVSAVASGTQVNEGPGSFRMNRKGNRVAVCVDMDLAGQQVGNNSLTVLTPMLVNGADTASLSTVGLYGRRRWFYYQRNEKRIDDAFKDVNFRSKDMPDGYRWEEMMDWRAWMDGASVEIRRQLYGCCNGLVKEDVLRLGNWNDDTYVPEYIWAVPVAEKEKIRMLEGTAYVDFPVSETVIYPDYRANRREIGKILSSIDTLRHDADVELLSLSIKGFASPESPYSNNTRLASGRTEALKDYVSQLYRFEDGFISTSYEPEDWEGLRRFVESSNMKNRDGILALIDGSLAPDAKEWKLKTLYPDDYRFLLDTIYPALRHSDYVIKYKVKSWHNPEDIRKVFEISPGKLSLNELHILASACEPGSEEFCRVFDVAVLIYPDDPVANLNAANVAMMKGELDKAEAYIAKAENLPEAAHAREVLEALRKNMDK